MHVSNQFLPVKARARVDVVINVRVVCINVRVVFFLETAKKDCKL